MNVDTFAHLFGPEENHLVMSLLLPFQFIFYIFGTFGRPTTWPTFGSGISDAPHVVEVVVAGVEVAAT